MEPQVGDGSLWKEGLKEMLPGTCPGISLCSYGVPGSRGPGTVHFLLSLYSTSPLFPVVEFLECSMCHHHKDAKTISGSEKVIEGTSLFLFVFSPSALTSDSLCPNVHFWQRQGNKL